MKQTPSRDQSSLPLHPTPSSTLNPLQPTQQPQPNSSSFMLTTPLHSSLQTKKTLNQITDLYNQIHSTINDMDTKVQHVIKKHQTQFLFAYRSHIKKIKKQLSQIKYKSEEQEKMFSSNDRIQYLEQELAIFREETMKVYNRLDQKNLQIDLLKIKVKDLEKQCARANLDIRDQLKIIKFEQMNKINLQERITALQAQLQQKNQHISQLNLKLDLTPQQSIRNSLKLQPSGLNQNTLFNISSTKKSQTSRSPLRSPVRSPNPSAYNTTTKFHPFKQPQSPRIYDTDLKQWFLQCIKTVKREIAQRNNNQKALELNNITSIDEFMMIDKLRLLEIFLENQRLLVYMYERIFPDRLAGLREKLSTGNHITLPKSTKQPSISTDRQHTKSVINQDSLTDRYRAQTKVSQLPKVIGRVSQHKTKISTKNQWLGNIILKDGKLNISMQ